jgi:hypothetical protein
VAGLRKWKKNEATQPSSEDDFDRSPVFSSQDIQVAGKSYAKQKIREENINCRSKNQVIEYSPVGDVPSPEIPNILS